MSNRPPEPALYHRLLILLSATMIVAGVVLGIWAVTNLPSSARSATRAVLSPSTTEQPAGSAVPSTPPKDAAAPTPTPVPAPLPVDVSGAPASLQTELAVLASGEVPFTTTMSNGTTPVVAFSAASGRGTPIYQLTFAAAVRFDTVEPAIPWDVLQTSWASGTVTFTAVAVISDTLQALAQRLGAPGPTVRGYASIDEVAAAVWEDRTALALVPFDLLSPRLAVLAVDGQNPVENSAHFDPARYPLVATVFATVQGSPAEEAAARRLLAGLPDGNRDPQRLTVLAMTGVTAMCRMTAAQMDRFGPAWPAEVVGPELASADITHISNEVPFVPGCETNTSADNLTFCSKPSYMAALEASGADIIGLTGNHQNDFGRANALVSLDIYADAGLPVYGGGRNKEEAFAPLYVEHNGNRLAFLGANSYGPKLAWATDSQPGSAEFDLAIMSATIRSIKEQGRADLVLAELQYQESYETQPLLDQRQDFTALVRAGADIVTGVQSHVPQGMEFTDGKLVVYGLGNLYFDQMWGQATREGMIVKHTIYAGRHISTQILTTLLYDYGQPRWTTPAQRASLLQRVFAASYW